MSEADDRIPLMTTPAEPFVSTDLGDGYKPIPLPKSWHDHPGGWRGKLRSLNLTNRFDPEDDDMTEPTEAPLEPVTVEPDLPADEPSPLPEPTFSERQADEEFERASEYEHHEHLVEQTTGLTKPDEYPRTETPPLVLHGQLRREAEASIALDRDQTHSAGVPEFVGPIEVVDDYSATKYNASGELDSETSFSFCRRCEIHVVSVLEHEKQAHPHDSVFVDEAGESAFRDLLDPKEQVQIRNNVRELTQHAPASGGATVGRKADLDQARELAAAGYDPFGPHWGFKGLTDDQRKEVAKSAR